MTVFFIKDVVNAFKGVWDSNCQNCFISFWEEVYFNELKTLDPIGSKLFSYRKDLFFSEESWCAGKQTGGHKSCLLSAQMTANSPGVPIPLAEVFFFFFFFFFFWPVWERVAQFACCFEILNVRGLDRFIRRKSDATCVFHSPPLPLEYMVWYHIHIVIWRQSVQNAKVYFMGETRNIFQNMSAEKFT